MGEMAKKLLSIKEIEERCNNWIKAQNTLNISHDCAKRKLDELDELNEEYFETDSEFYSVSESGKKRRRVGTQMKDEILKLSCSWKDCTFFDCNSMSLFVKHVANHVSSLKIRNIDQNTQAYVCQWQDCAYESTDSQEITRHVNFHSYHTKLKCIGSNIRGRVKLPKCRRDPEWKNIIDVPLTHICQWNECLKIFTNYNHYINHVNTHIENNPRGKKVKGGVKCKWTGCNGNYDSLYKLRDHMRCHTKEKTVACPHCGAMFASNTKFHDHCRRQIPLEVQGFQCSHCNKFYPTENILRDHMRFHVFSYKCTMCDMSCESPASLAKHVRYRHMDTKSYPCQLCSHAAKSQQDLDSHMTVHTTGPNFLCHYEGCSYTCKGAYILDRHIERVHNLEVRWYCCHECPIKYRKSYRLTKHLMDTHHLQWPSGHKRFQYTRDEDGCYRLQMVRYESIDEETIITTPIIEEKLSAPKKFKIDVVQTTTFPKFEIVECKDSENEDDTLLQLSNETFKNSLQGELKLKHETKNDNLKPRNSLEVIKCDNEKTIAVHTISNILISIDEIDEHGNIIESKIVEAQETTELPPSSEPPIILK